MLKLSCRQLQQIVKISKRAGNDKIVRKMKERVKRDPKVISKFKEYNIPISDIDIVHVEFCPLDVSAKTKDRKIYINEHLLTDSDQDPTHYLVHELMHYLQQVSGSVKRNSADDYLDKPTEEEAFKAQIDWKKRREGHDEAEEYTENLLDHHDLDGKKREKKKKELLGK